MLSLRSILLRTASSGKRLVVFKMAARSSSLGGSLSSPVKSPTLQFYRRPLPTTCIDFASDEGKLIFSQALAAGYMNSFFKLCSQYRTQDEPAYCGLTSLVMALNVLEIDPGRVWKGPWRWYHEDMLDCCTSLQVAREKGINMEQFVCLARCNNLAAMSVLGSEINSIEHLREEIKAATVREDVVLVASYSRKSLGQTGTGHFSPIAGYHEGRDLVLILDTARFKYPPHWVSVATLLEAMKTIDPETGRSRGYIILSSATNQPSLLLFRPSYAFTIDKQKGKYCSQLIDFAQEWTDRLSVVSGKLQSPKEIIELAIKNMQEIQSRENLFISMFSLTLPYEQSDSDIFVVPCPQAVKGEEKVACIIKQLLNEIEKLETFKVAKEYFRNKSMEEKSKFMSYIQSPDLGLDLSTVESDSDSCCKSDCSDHASVPCCKAKNSSHEISHAYSDCGSSKTKPIISAFAVDSAIETQCSACEGVIAIGPEHAATLFLQVWPHVLFPVNKPAVTSHQCSSALDQTAVSTEEAESKTLGQALVEFISSDLSRTGGRYVRDEIGTIKVKIREVLRYHTQGFVTCCDRAHSVT
ncbi:uncharacterized protein LOC131930318 [Physella acuta]|uniref:uncharacterized protein LOC131930318 n=1 Tax=Physella acuta TaxID=109671 RepID=UPI0027DAB5A3|nr:uncharacterized protein LOC131930318 [Physella acuta]